MEDAVIDEEFLSRFEIMQQIGVVDGNGGRGGMRIDAED
jgi:Asp-tRNA(Asn)/Glu-tRNA(Gln) amidotransferase B subunit